MNKHILSALVALALFLPWEGSALAADLAAQTSNAGGVKVTVTLRKFTSASKTIDFAVALETHTHPLNEALENVSVLIADGRQYPPLSWEGTPPGGHHRKGVLHFKALDPMPVEVELQIGLAGDNATRTFKWTLQPAENGRGTGNGK